MMMTTTTKLRAISFLGAAALLGGCTAGTKASNAGSAGNTGTAGGGGTTGTGGTSTGSGGGGIDASFDFGADRTGNDGVCSSNSVPAQPVPLDLYMVMDTSKSMNDATGANNTGPSKWEAVKTAMKSFFMDGGSAGLGIGLKYFPQEQAGVMATCAADSDCTTAGAYGPCDFRLGCIGNNVYTMPVDTGTQLCQTATTSCANSGETCQRIKDCGTAGSCVAGPAAPAGSCAGCTNFTGYCRGRDICAPASYAMPDVAIAALPGAMTALGTSLDAHSPGGYTPTGPALQGAIDFAHQRLSTVADHRIAIVLVTDGLPGGFIPGFPQPGCTPADVPGIVNILTAASRPTMGTPLLTFVIGVFKPEEKATAQSNLDMLAAAGQPAASNGKAVVIDTSQNVSQALQAALSQVQSKAIPCDFQIPSTGVNPGEVNVTFKGSNGDVPIGHAPAADGKMGAGCDARGGWYYDTDYKNDAGTPSKITACPATCQMFQADLAGKVNVVLGCPTINVD